MGYQLLVIEGGSRFPLPHWRKLLSRLPFFNVGGAVSAAIGGWRLGADALFPLLDGVLELQNGKVQLN
jgi:hypothetical protein